MYISPKGLSAESCDLMFNILPSSGYGVPSFLHLVNVCLKLCKHAEMENHWHPSKPWHALSQTQAEDPASVH